MYHIVMNFTIIGLPSELSIERPLYIKILTKNPTGLFQQTLMWVFHHTTKAPD